MDRRRVNSNFQDGGSHRNLWEAAKNIHRHVRSVHVNRLFMVYLHWLETL